MASKATTLEVPGPDGQVRSLRLSSPDRVMCPAGDQPGSTDVTKLDLWRAYSYSHGHPGGSRSVEHEMMWNPTT